MRAVLPEGAAALSRSRDDTRPRPGYLDCSDMTLIEHPKCRACGLLFGRGHIEEDTTRALCRFCERDAMRGRARAKRRREYAVIRLARSRSSCAPNPQGCAQKPLV